MISPVLGNIYLQFVLDDWFEKVVEKETREYAEMVRYVDDSVTCFEYEEGAERKDWNMFYFLQKFCLKNKN